VAAEQVAEHPGGSVQDDLAVVHERALVALRARIGIPAIAATTRVRQDSPCRRTIETVERDVVRGMGSRVPVTERSSRATVARGGSSIRGADVDVEDRRERRTGRRL